MTNRAILIKKMRRVSDSITRANNTTQYTAADVISEVTSDDHFSFANVFEPGVYSGTIESAILVSSAYHASGLAADLHLFHTDVAEVVDNLTAAFTDAEMLTTVGVVRFLAANYIKGGPNAMIQQTDINLPIRLIAGTDPGDGTPKPVVLYGQLVARNAYQPIANEVITVVLNIRAD